MKLICIKDFEEELKAVEEKGKPSPFFMEEVTSLQSKLHNGDLYYQLDGRFDRRSGFRADYFAILPDKSADEMSQEVKEAIVNIETPVI